MITALAVWVVASIPVGLFVARFIAAGGSTHHSTEATEISA